MRAGLADALLKQGARQDAVAAAAEILPALEGGVTSMRCLNRLRIVRQAAGNTAGTQEFCERFDAVERTLSASYGLPCEDTSDARADIPALTGTNKSPRGVGRETRFVTGLTPAVSAMLDATDECGPCLRPDGQAGAVRVL